MPAEIDARRTTDSARSTNWAISRETRALRGTSNGTSKGFVDELLRIPISTLPTAPPRPTAEPAETAATNAPSGSETAADAPESEQEREQDSDEPAICSLPLPTPVIEAQNRIVRGRRSHDDGTSKATHPANESSPIPQERPDPAASQLAVESESDLSAQGPGHKRQSKPSVVDGKQGASIHERSLQDGNKAIPSSTEADKPIVEPKLKQREGAQTGNTQESKEPGLATDYQIASTVTNLQNHDRSSGDRGMESSTAIEPKEAAEGARGRRRTERSTRSRNEGSKDDTGIRGETTARSEPGHASRDTGVTQGTSSSLAGQHGSEGEPSTDANRVSTSTTPDGMVTVAPTNSAAPTITSPAATPTGPAKEAGARAADNARVDGSAGTASVSPYRQDRADAVRSAASTTGSSSLSKYQETKLVQRVMRGMEQLANGGGQVKLRLHPPELGAMQLTMRIENNVVSAQMDVESTAAQEALVKNLQTLRDKLSEQGIQVDRIDVNVDPNAFQSGTTSGGAADQQGATPDRQQLDSRYAALQQNRVGKGEKATASETQRSWTRTHGLFDVQA